MKESVNCPCLICGARDSSLGYEIQYSKLNYPGTFSLRQCSGCGLLFNSPRLSTEEVNRFYTTDYYFFNRQDKDEFSRILNLYRRTLKPIENQIAIKTVLEIGCGKGYLLALLKRCRWNVFGIELSPRASEFARKKFNLDVFTGTLEDYTKQNSTRKVSVVLLLDVIEHIPFPDLFLERISDLLTESGYLIIDTPNSDSVSRIQCGAQWQGFNPYHIFIFNKQNLSALLQKYHLSRRMLFSYGNFPAEHPEKPSAAGEDKPAKNKIKQLIKKTLHPDLYRFLCLCAKKILDPFLRRHFLRKTVRQAKKEISYFDTPDSRGPLAAGQQGNKLVIIACKESTSPANL